MSSHGTRPIELLRRAGIVHDVHEYRLPTRAGRARDARPNYGLEAAGALGVAPDRVFKTLVVDVDGRLALAVIGVDRELVPKALAGALGGRRAELAPPLVAERATGYVVGGISPLATRRGLPVVVDATPGSIRILVSAGRRGLQVELAVSDLVALTGATVAPISRRKGQDDLVPEA